VIVVRKKLLLALLLASIAAGGSLPAVEPAGAPMATHPDFSGFWNIDTRIPKDAELMKQIAPNTVVLDDRGPKDYPPGNFGGLKLRPAAQETARKWDPYEQLKPENACKASSIVSAFTAPFPIEVFQSEPFIVMKLEVYDLVRLIFLDGRKAEPDYPDSKVGFSSGHWEGSTLVVETTHLEPATITNNGLDHTSGVRVLERFKLSPDGKTLLATQEFEDPAVLENRGARFMAWRKQPGQHVFPWDCDPTFAGNYNYAKPGETQGKKPSGKAQ
jgi:hypothetical protein